MADEHDQLFEAAKNLDGRIQPKQNNASTDADAIPEDATEVPDSRDVSAIRGGEPARK